MIRIIVILCCLCFSLKTDAQIQQDTIQISELCIVLSFPGEYIKKEYLYEEGIFYDYIIPQESSVITIHVGAMISLPLIDKNDIISCRMIENILNDEIGTYIENGMVNYCRELNILPYHLNITYDKVSPSLKDKYNFIFDNIKIFKRQCNH